MAKTRAQKPEQLAEYRQNTRENNLVAYKIRVLKSHAKSRGQGFNISAPDVPMPTACPNCGKELRVTRAPRIAQHDFPATIRLDLSIGFVPGNVKTLCWECADPRLRGKAFWGLISPIP